MTPDRSTRKYDPWHALSRKTARRGVPFGGGRALAEGLAHAAGLAVLGFRRGRFRIGRPPEPQALGMASKPGAAQGGAESAHDKARIDRPVGAAGEAREPADAALPADGAKVATQAGESGR